MNKPSPSDARKLFELRCQCKQGHHPDTDDMKFLDRMFKDFPEYYESLSKAVFEETKPAGAR